ncbi:hypothetical protein CPC08DRAFT_704603 [Agrocybe pediades]|nr:hypothetical protein CPC08DRAFT_704603 [Agrocybe pediades]
MFSAVASRTILRTGPLRAATAASASRYESTRLYSSTMHDNDPDLLEREKARNLSGRTGKQFGSPHEHAPGWNEKLASSSEAAVKADRSDGTTIELQSRTVEHMKSSRAVEADEESTNSASSRDSVEGPLSGARSEVEKK